MHLDADGRVVPYLTKKARIDQLEAAMARIASGTLPLAECVALAASMRRTDKKWREKSPRGYEAVKAAEDAERGDAERGDAENDG